MHSVQETLALIEQACPVLDPERVALPHAQGRVLREEILAPDDVPAFDRASMDGFAVRLDDPGPTFEIVGEIRAGQQAQIEPRQGQAVRIFTGGAVPAPGLQVVMQEDTDLTGHRLTIRRRDDDPNIRFRGEDARQGSRLLSSGIRLRAGHLSLLASLGHTHPLVTRLPSIAHFATGDELVPPDVAPLPAQIRDSNSTLIRALIEEAGIGVRQAHLPEDADAAWRQLANETSSDADLLLLSGGASVGRYDHTGSLLERLGYRILVSKVNSRPGKPLIFAARERRVAFGLPGNPLSHLVCYHLFVAAALRRLLGLPVPLPMERGFLSSDLTDCASPRETYWPASFRLVEGTARVTPLRWQSSGDVTALPGIEALLHIPAATESVAAGTPVDFLPTRLSG